MSAKTVLLVTGILGGLGIIVGAFGAHALPNILKDLPEEELIQRRDWLETGVKYHMYHVAALLAISCATDNRLINFTSSAVAWIVGILIFSGCLYAMTFTGIKVLGAVVPIGGLAFITGWFLLCIKALDR